MLMRLKLSSHARTFDVCPAAVAVLMAKHALSVCERYTLALLDLENVEQVRLERSAGFIRCDHHNGYLGSCP